MKFSAAVVLALVLASPYPGCSSASMLRRRGETAVKAHPKATSRMLRMMDFTPLDCNVDLPTVTCQPWSYRFGTVAEHTERVIVECGECVEMDLAISTLSLLDGLDVRGKLVFPDRVGQELTVTTTMVVVQGELVVHSMKPVDGIPAVRFVMTGETDQFFEPHDNNALNCEMGGLCNAGKKAIAVAGGRIEVIGLPDPEETPAWVKLYHVENFGNNQESPPVDGVVSQYVPPPAGNGCAADGNYFGMMLDHGSCGDRDEFAGTVGSKITCTSTAFSNYGRTSTLHGAQLDLKHFRLCLEATSRIYLLTARVRLTGNIVNNGNATDCAARNENCLVIQQEWADAGFRLYKSTVWKETPALFAKHGETITIATEVSFDPVHLDASNVYQIFKLVGPGPAVNVEVEEFHFYHPPASVFPPAGTECDTLVPVVSDAEHGYLSAFPFYLTHPWMFATVQEDPIVAGNHFFSVRGRNGRAAERAGLSWDLEPLCLREGDTLSFQIEIRQPIGYQAGGQSLVLKPYLRAEFEAGTVDSQLLARCPAVDESKGDWVVCEGSLVVPTAYLGADVTKLSVLLGATPGMDYDVDEISLVVVTQVESDPDTLVVDRAVLGRWAPGAEVLITSHTAAWDGGQVGTIRDVWEHSHPDYARVQLLDPFIKPTTLVDSSDFAVEVALLSRNIVFEGGLDQNPLHGGHFWVLHTPMVEQHIQGLEVRNFGQQGTLGRYPIHFHFCGDVPGSLVSKNTVRYSNQRAIVVHGTNKLRVSENVVFSTKGHAIMLEDGIETDNIFYRNLGAATAKVEVVIPDNGFNGQESDAFPSTFWISNPTNIFIENVAAGSQSSGYWFELKKRGTRADHFPDLDPKQSNLGQFLNNIAHSNEDRGLRTYPVGFVPPETAELINFKSYRNKNKGLFFHLTQNMAIINGTFADNGIAIDLDRADFIDVTDTTIVGQTELYKHLVAMQVNVPTVCSNRDELIGIEVHTFARRIDNHGGKFKNVHFSGFEPGTCGLRVAHVALDNEVLRYPSFDWLSSFENSSTSEPVMFDFCPADAANVKDSYLVDADGSMNGINNAGIPGTFVSNSENMLAFLQAEQCTMKPSECRAYCEACFRTVRFETDPEGTGDFFLQVCDAATSSTCVKIQGFIDPDEDKAHKIDNLRTYNAHLPHGSYTASFVSVATGQEKLWPTFVAETYEDILCAGSFEDGAVQLVMPLVADFPAECGSMIRNGDMENGLNGWLYNFGGPLVLYSGAGLDGSTAIADSHRAGTRDSISTFLDTRCLKASQAVGRWYEVMAWVKLIDPVTGVAYNDCHRDGSGCPEVRLILSDGPARSYVATRVPQLAKDAGSFQLLHGILTVDQEISDSTAVEFAIRRNRNDVFMQVDGVSMTLMPIRSADPASCVGSLVQNGDFSDGTAKFWSRSSSVTELVSDASGYHLSLSNGGNAQVFLKAGCFVTGELYEVTVQYRILDESGQLAGCDPAARDECPSADIMPYKTGTLSELQRNIVNALEVKNGEWNMLYGFFYANEATATAYEVMLLLKSLDSTMSYILNSVSIQHKLRDCSSNVLANGDMSMGVTNFWGTVGSGSVEFSANAMLALGRERLGHGPRYNTGSYMDERCLVPGVTWEISAQIKVLDAATGAPTDCNIGDPTSSPKACPAIRVEIKDPNGVQLVNVQLREYASASWDISGWNMFRATVTLPSGATWDGRVSRVLLQWLNYPLHMNLLVDSFIVRQV